VISLLIGLQGFNKDKMKKPAEVRDASAPIIEKPSAGAPTNGAAASAPPSASAGGLGRGGGGRGRGGGTVAAFAAQMNGRGGSSAPMY